MSPRRPPPLLPWSAGGTLLSYALLRAFVVVVVVVSLISWPRVRLTNLIPPSLYHFLLLLLLSLFPVPATLYLGPLLRFSPGPPTHRPTKPLVPARRLTPRTPEAHSLLLGSAAPFSLFLALRVSFSSFPPSPFLYRLCSLMFTRFLSSRDAKKGIHKERYRGQVIFFPRSLVALLRSFDLFPSLSISSPFRVVLLQLATTSLRSCHRCSVVGSLVQRLQAA